MIIWPPLLVLNKIDQCQCHLRNSAELRVNTLNEAYLVARLDRRETLSSRAGCAGGRIGLANGDCDLFIALFKSTFSRFSPIWLLDSEGDSFPDMEFLGDGLECGPWNEFVGETFGGFCA